MLTFEEFCFMIVLLATLVGVSMLIIITVLSVYNEDKPLKKSISKVEKETKKRIEKMNRKCQKR